MPGCTCLDTTAPTRANRRSPLATASPRPRIERGRHRVEVALDLLVAGLDLLEPGTGPPVRSAIQRANASGHSFVGAVVIVVIVLGMVTRRRRDPRRG
jgi:hypothetical protein